MSVTIVVTAAFELFLEQYSDGTWKSPVKTPVFLPVSTNVKPEAPRPSFPAGVPFAAVPAA
jgi:hypothetical protein